MSEEGGGGIPRENYLVLADFYMGNPTNGLEFRPLGGDIDSNPPPPSPSPNHFYNQHIWACLVCTVAN
jgi:hypothetical protein